MPLPPKSEKFKRPRTSIDLTQTNPITLKSIREEYHNPDPITRLVGRLNEACILIDEVECLALIDSGAQISTISLESVEQLGLQIQQLDRMLKFKTMGRGDIPYLGYVEINLKILKIEAFDDDVLMFVIKNSKYVR